MMERLHGAKLPLAIFFLFASALLVSAQNSFRDEIANLRSPNVSTRVKAAKALGRSGRPEAVPALTEAMRDPEKKVREATTKALRRFNSAETIDGLLIGLSDEEKRIREESLVAMLEIYVGVGNADIGGRFDWVYRKKRGAPELMGLVPVGDEVVRGLSRRLADEEPKLRKHAAYSLGVLRAESAVDVLGGAFSDPDKGVRIEAARSLGRIGTDAAGETLRVALHDSSKDMIVTAVDALGDMRFEPAASDLVNVYDDNQGKLADRALRALALIGAPQARGIFYYQMTSKDAKRRRWAAEGLGRLGDETLVSGLMKDFLREPHTSVQLAYAFSIAMLGRPEFVDRVALSLADRKLRDQARAYAVELGSPLLSELVKYLADPVPEVRREMAQVLMDIGDPAAIPHLEPLLSDPNGEVADLANRAIARLREGAVSAASIP